MTNTKNKTVKKPERQILMWQHKFPANHVSWTDFNGGELAGTMIYPPEIGDILIMNTQDMRQLQFKFTEVELDGKNKFAAKVSKPISDKPVA